MSAIRKPRQNTPALQSDIRDAPSPRKCRFRHSNIFLAVPLRVFIVEDHPDTAESISRLLSIDDLCKTVAVAGSEKEALAWSFQNEAGFDVAILDLLLREGSGFAVLNHLVKYQPGQVFVVSDFVTPEIAERCIKLGATAAFRKSQIAECIQHVRALASDAGNDRKLRHRPRHRQPT